MASISVGAGGNRLIQFIDGRKKRKTIRLGKRTGKSAEKIKTKVEALIADAIARKPHTAEVAKWIRQIEHRDQSLYDKLAAHELVAPRSATGQVTLGNFLNGYIGKRSDVEPGTAITYGNVRRNLVDYFGADRLLDSITPAEADDWRRWLRLAKNEEDPKAGGQGLSDNTVRRRCGVARQFFHDAVRRRLVYESPFADMQGVVVRPNRKRDYFVTRDEAANVLEACPDAQWRLLFALSRYGGLRCPSEHLSLCWGDVDWTHGRITVRSPKTVRARRERPARNAVVSGAGAVPEGSTGRAARRLRSETETTERATRHHAVP